MSTPGLPALPTRRQLARKVDRYRAISEAHRAGAHTPPDPKRCVSCRRESEQS